MRRAKRSNNNKNNNTNTNTNKNKNKNNKSACELLEEIIEPRMSKTKRRD